MIRNWQALFQQGGVGSPEWVAEMESLEADVAAGSGGSQTLAQVLAAGNDAGGQNIVDVGDLSLAGLTGATAGARFVGGTVSGAPVAGTFAVGDFVIDQSGGIWVCTAAGAPGTWVAVGGAASGGLAGVYGDGSDGAVVFDGTSTVLGLVPSSSTYTLTRDIFTASCVVDSGVSIRTQGYRVFCTGTLTNNGTIGYYLPGANSSSGIAGGTGLTFSSKGAPGGNGGTGAGAAGQSAGSGFGGAGGAGGSGSGGANAGGAGGTVTAPSPSYGSWRALPTALNGFYASSGSATGVFSLGGGGGAGGGDGTNKGGGGGGSGGPVPVYAKTIAGAGVLEAVGGNGSVGLGGNSGAGGGGGGGLVLVISASVVAGAVPGQTINVAGGSGGEGSGTGANGADGSAGLSILIPG